MKPIIEHLRDLTRKYKTRSEISKEAAENMKRVIEEAKKAAQEAKKKKE